jgi:hypothetical protein
LYAVDELIDLFVLLHQLLVQHQMYLILHYHHLDHLQELHQVVLHHLEFLQLVMDEFLLLLWLLFYVVELMKQQMLK